jgi:hypothetical protein
MLPYRRAFRAPVRFFNDNEDGIWNSTELAVGCYQDKEFGEVGLAGTSCGL